MFRSIAAVVVLMVASSSVVNAQTIYAPVQYQYGTENNRYYYGGSNPAVFALAERQRGVDMLGDHPFTSERYTDAYQHRRLIGQIDRVYSDAVPYMNARVFGYLRVDAANDANANVPRYFRKADLLRASVELSDGSRIVLPQAQPVPFDRNPLRIRVIGGATTKPKAIIIIPRGKAGASDKLVASAVR
jgi:hypothetical protein